jgi:type VI protein secretion system component VasF
MQIVFFKRPQHRQFEYKPRYYDEEKERREERRKALEEGAGGNASTLKRDIDRRWRKIDRQNRNKSKSVNLLVYLIIAALLAYFVFFV